MAARRRHHGRPRHAPTSTPPCASAADVTLFPGVVLQGATVVGEGTEIGPGTRLVDCVVGARAAIEHTVARDAEIGDDAVVGPFAVLGPGAVGRRRAPHRALLHCARELDDERGRRRRWSWSPRRSCGCTRARSHPALAEEIAGHLGVELGRAQPPALRQRRDPLPVRRVGPRRRRLHHPDPLGRAARSTTRSWSS